MPPQELSEVVQVMEVVRDDAERAGQRGTAEALEEVIGRMMRWIWPLLGELDEQD